MDSSDSIISFSQGEIVLWAEDGRSIHLKAISSFGDPVELSAEEAKELAEALLRLAAAVE